MTKSTNKKRILTVLTLFMCGIIALFAVMFTAPQKTYASESGITFDNFPDTSTYTEQDVDITSSLEGKFFRVYNDGFGGEKVIYLLGDFQIKVMTGTGVYVMPYGGDVVEILISKDNSDFYTDFYVPIGKTYESNGQNKPLGLIDESLSGSITIKELIPIEEGNPDIVVEEDKFDFNEWLDNAGDDISEFFGSATGITLSSTLSLCIVVAILVAIFKRK